MLYPGMLSSGIQQLDKIESYCTFHQHTGLVAIDNALHYRQTHIKNRYQKSLETVFLIAICPQSVSKDFLTTFFDGINVFNCRLYGVINSVDKIQFVGSLLLGLLWILLLSL